MDALLEVVWNSFKNNMSYFPGIRKCILNVRIYDVNSIFNMYLSYNNSALQCGNMHFMYLVAEIVFFYNKKLFNYMASVFTL